MTPNDIEIGDWVAHPDFVNLRGTRPGPTAWAYLDPPILGVVDGVNHDRRTATVTFPGVGARIVGTCELTRVGRDGRLGE